jgi:hypothetical protein
MDVHRRSRRSQGFCVSANEPLALVAAGAGLDSIHHNESRRLLASPEPIRLRARPRASRWVLRESGNRGSATSEPVDRVDPLKPEVGPCCRHALFLLNRIRFAMDDSATAPRLTGIVEADETYVGGRPRAANLAPKIKSRKGIGGFGKKVPVLAAVQRGGRVRVRAVAKVTGENVREFLYDLVGSGARLMTDKGHHYVEPGKDFRGGHDTVRHGLREYARGDVTTNTIEGFFSLIKRKVYGTHHAISKEHLHRYVAEAAFLYNTRRADDATRVELAIKGAEGKRLTYREQSPAAA